MLSRIALPLVNITSKTVFRLPQRNSPIIWSSIASSSTASSIAKPTASNVATESDERDVVNFPRRKMPLYGGKVRLSFIPDEWFQFFYRKTGVTGPYLFGAGVMTYLYSKEWLIMEHEFYQGVSLVLFWTIIIKKYGTKIASFLDKGSDEEFQGMTDTLESMKQHHKDAIIEEEHAQKCTQGQNMLFDAKRENVLFQLEAEYRKRLLETYQEVKKYLDYHVQVVNTTRQVQHKHMVNWIIDSVVRSISPQQEEETLKKCISDLKLLSAAH